MIVAKLDVMKVDKSKLFEGKRGAKYLDICLIETPDSQYGDDYVVTQSVSKEDRAAGKRGAILGNAKIMGQRRTPQAQNDPPPAQQQVGDEADSVPF